MLEIHRVFHISRILSLTRDPSTGYGQCALLPPSITTADMPETLAAYASYLAEVRMRRPTTIKRYIDVLEDFVAFLVAERKTDQIALDAVDKKQLTAFLRRSARGEKESSRAVWNARLSALRSFYDYLFKQELILVNPAHRLDRFKIHAKEPIPLSLDEYLALVEAMRTSGEIYRARNVAIVEVMFHCALRVAEVVSLDIMQVDFENRVFLNVRTKGNKRLSVVFNDVVSVAVEAYLKDRKQTNGEAAVFLSDRGTRLSIRAVQELIKSYAKRARILRTVTPHLLRHSSATQLVELGTSMRVVQEICGHASVTTTERYVHVNGGARRWAIDELGAAVEKRTNGKRRRGRRSRTEPPDSS